MCFCVIAARSIIAISAMRKHVKDIAIHTLPAVKRLPVDQLSEARHRMVRVKYSV